MKAKTPWILPTHRKKHWRYTIALALFAIPIIVACSCSGTVPIEFPASNFSVENVEIVTCKDIEGQEPKSVTQVFTEEDDKICIFVKAKLKEDINDIRTLLPPDVELPALTFTEYYNGQKMSEILTMPYYSPDGWVIGVTCSEVTQGRAPKGIYKVKVTLASTEVGTVEYERKQKC